MSYITGNASNFLSRLHQLPTGLYELSGRPNSFINEGVSYSVYPVSLQNSWNKEFNKKFSQITHSGITDSKFTILSPLISGDIDTIHLPSWVGGSPFSWVLSSSLDSINWSVSPITIEGFKKDLFVDTGHLYWKIYGVDVNNNVVTLLSNITTVGFTPATPAPVLSPAANYAVSWPPTNPSAYDSILFDYSNNRVNWSFNIRNFAFDDGVTDSFPGAGFVRARFYNGAEYSKYSNIIQLIS